MGKPPRLYFIDALRAFDLNDAAGILSVACSTQFLKTPATPSILFGCIVVALPRRCSLPLPVGCLPFTAAQ